MASLSGVPTVMSGENWSEAVVVDSAMLDDERIVVFTVAPRDAGPAEEMEIDGRRYACATT